MDPKEIKNLKPGERVRLTTNNKVRHYVVDSIGKNQVVCFPLNHGGGVAYIHLFNTGQWKRDKEPGELA